MMHLAATPPALQMVSAVSRKTHGSFTFDINLPLTGPTGVECRSGTAHQLVVTFSHAISTGVASLVSGIATVGQATVTGRELIVPLTGVANAQAVTISVSGVTDVYGQSVNSQVFGVRFLAGDLNGSGNVSTADFNLIRTYLLQEVLPGSFRADVNASRTLSTTDFNLVRNSLLTEITP
jgi:hypothetical protein